MHCTPDRRVALSVLFCFSSFVACSGIVGETFDAGTPAGGGAGGGNAGGGVSTGGGGSTAGGAGGGTAGAGGGTAGGSGGGTAGGSAGGGTGGGFVQSDGGFLGASRCTGSGLLFCDDFEGGTVGQVPTASTWSASYWDSSTASLKIDSTVAARGSKAVKFHNNKPGNKAVMTLTQPFPLQKFWVRLFLYANEVPPHPNACTNGAYPLVHWTVGFAKGPTSTTQGTLQPEMRALDFIDRTLIVNEDGMDKNEVGQDDNQNVPAGQSSLAAKKWVCFELYFDAPGKEIRVFWDELEHPAMHVSNSRSIGGDVFEFPDDHFSSLNLGVQHYQDCSPENGFTGFDVWLDEVAVDANRIGCSK